MKPLDGSYGMPPAKSLPTSGALRPYCQTDDQTDGNKRIGERMFVYGLTLSMAFRAACV
jgi:hypothetical protein